MHGWDTHLENAELLDPGRGLRVFTIKDDVSPKSAGEDTRTHVCFCVSDRVFDERDHVIEKLENSSLKPMKLAMCFFPLL